MLYTSLRSDFGLKVPPVLDGNHILDLFGCLVLVVLGTLPQSFLEPFRHLLAPFWSILETLQIASVLDGNNILDIFRLHILDLNEGPKNHNN